MKSLAPTIDPRSMVIYRGAQMPRQAAVSQQNQDVGNIMQDLLANVKMRSLLPSQLYAQVFGQRNNDIELPNEAGMTPIQFENQALYGGLRNRGVGKR